MKLGPFLLNQAFVRHAELVQQTKIVSERLRVVRLGSANAANVAKATLEGLQRLRLRQEIYQSRGLATGPRNPTPVAATPAPIAPAAV